MPSTSRRPDAGRAMDRLTAFTSSRVADEWPDDLQHGELVIVQKTPGGPKRAHYLCPCGCGDPLMIPEAGSIHNLDCTQSPCWTITQEQDGTWTISPSVLMTSPMECKSHYFVRSNRIDWC
jgi:hypothetical protein